MNSFKNFSKPMVATVFFLILGSTAGAQPPPPPPPPPAAGIPLDGAIIGLLFGISIAVLYCRNIQQMLKEIGEERRAVPHQNVWLMCIPFFNIIYAFIFYPKVSESIAAEYKYRGMTLNGDYEKKLGLALSILPLSGFIPYVNIFTSIIQLVVFIIYWYRISYHRRQFRSNPIAE